MNAKRTTKEFVKRYIFLCIGLSIMAFGVAFSIKATLGTSPVSSVPYVAECITGISVGTATIIMHCIFIIAQILILRRKYEIIQLLQLPVALIFGVMNDVALYIIRDINPQSYAEQWIFCIISIILTAIGVSIEVTADVVVLAGEGLVLAICKVFPVKFGNMKVIFDVILVCISIVTSLIILGKLEGVREGTIAAAICVGLISKQINKHTDGIEKMLSS